MRARIFGLSALLLTAAADQPTSLTLSGDNTVSVTINGEQVRIKADPAYAGLVTVNPDVVTRARLKPSMIGTMHMVGPVIIGFRTDAAKVDFGYGRQKRRVMWPDRPIISGVDGIAGGTQPDRAGPSPRFRPVDLCLLHQGIRIDRNWIVFTCALVHM